MSKRPARAAKQVEEVLNNEPAFAPLSLKAKWDRVVSTGSTNLDLAISGGRLTEGGIPAGIIAEIHGPSGVGKTAFAMEIAASCQERGGQVRILDPEARLDLQYAESTGLDLDPAKFEYFQPDTVDEMFNEYIAPWEPTDPDAMNCVIADSLAALTTKLEIDTGDKMGMRRAKEFSAGMRRYARLINSKGWLLFCTNQIRQGDSGYVAPGGKALEFYPSLRINIRPDYRKGRKREIKREARVFAKRHSKTVGINALCKCVKNSLDDPYREAPITYWFGYGVHDIMGCLQYLKDCHAYSTYRCPDDIGYKSIIQAAMHVAKEGLEKLLKEEVIETWREIENELSVTFPKKKRR